MSDCSHHWLIEPANGSTSQGRCKHCGEVREFANYIESEIGGLGTRKKQDGRQRYKQQPLRLGSPEREVQP